MSRPEYGYGYQDHSSATPAYSQQRHGPRQYQISPANVYNHPVNAQPPSYPTFSAQPTSPINRRSVPSERQTYTYTGPPAPPPHYQPTPSLEQPTSGHFRNMSALQDVDRLYSVPEPSFSDVDDSPPEHYSRTGIPTAFSRGHRHNDSYDSTVPLTQPNSSYARNDSPTRRMNTSPSEFPPPRPLQSSPIRKPLYSRPSRWEDHDIDPRFIADDGDDVFDSPSKPSRKGYTVSPDAAAVPIAGNGFLPKAFASRDASGNYGPLPGGGSEANRGFDGRAEKNILLESETRRRKKRMWIILGVIAALAILGAVGGVVGYMLSRKHSANSSASSSSLTSSSTGSSSDGDLDANSQEVKDLLGNTNLHRVFPGMDYTPLNAQYPACLTVPPSQNNVTLDVAMLSQLTPAIRLYGTDCKQTEMVLTAIDRLNMNDTVKVWLGVWLENNSTTNTRQLAQMYDILTRYPSAHFEGVIVGNEVLFREDLTLTQLSSVLKQVRTNLTNLNVDLPVATSDLGDNWTAGLAQDTDIVMANIHPFFAGVVPDAATAWTWEFWQQHDVVLMTDATKTSTGQPHNIISEVGWPSSGGNDCGTTSGCPNGTAGSVAGIEEMNTFLDSWVCEAMQNGTTYFWFEAFDEPWKHIYDTDTDGWESQWGLMDANRNLKQGLKIPDCGGKTVG